jgi:hypothetical protein
MRCTLSGLDRVVGIDRSPASIDLDEARRRAKEWGLDQRALRMLGPGSTGSRRSRVDLVVVATHTLLFQAEQETLGLPSRVMERRSIARRRCAQAQRGIRGSGRAWDVRRGSAVVPALAPGGRAMVVFEKTRQLVPPHSIPARACRSWLVDPSLRPEPVRYALGGGESRRTVRCTSWWRVVPSEQALPLGRAAGGRMAGARLDLCALMQAMQAQDEATAV